jgi:hypothetical protein
MVVSPGILASASSGRRRRGTADRAGSAGARSHPVASGRGGAPVTAPSSADLMTVHPEHTLVDWVQLVRAEYLEMPGLQLTKPQVRRLWALEEQTCEAVLNELVSAHFLRRTAREAYVLDGPRC